MVEHYNEEQWEILNEITREYLNHDPVEKRCKDVYFVSRSSGKGRKERKPREVELLVVDEKFAYTISGEVIRDRSDKTPPDKFAMEVLTDLEDSKRSIEILLERARNLRKYR